MQSTLEKIRIALAKKETNFADYKTKVIKAAQTPPSCRSVSDSILIIKYLRFYSHFKEIDENVKLIEIFRRVQYRLLEKDTFLFHQGDDPDHYFIILDGMVGCGIFTSSRIAKYFPGEMEDVFYLKTGFGFGEVSILENCKRTRSVKAEKDSHILVISKEDCLSIFSSSQSRFKNSMIQSVIKMPIFENLPTESLKKLAMMCRFRCYKINELIVSQDSSCSGIFFVQTGKVKQYRLLHKANLNADLVKKYERNFGKLTFPISIFIASICKVISCEWRFRNVRISQ